MSEERDYSKTGTQTEVADVRRAFAVIIVLGLVTAIWGCVEEITPTTNSKPKIWFTRAPKAGHEVFDNSASFEWMATDIDDDLGMGQTYVAIEPTVVGADTVFPPELLLGPVRIYENIYDVRNMPDTVYTFSVTVRDGRGAETTVDRSFKVRFDDRLPIVDSVRCPPQKPTNPVFEWTFVIFSHDEALNPSAASPVESLDYWYRFVVPSGGDSYETPDFALTNNTYTVNVDGQAYKGVYKFRAKSRDRAGNVSEEYLCEFDISGPK
jgi:hypothetical protein